MSGKFPVVSVCVCTFRRQSYLSNLLEALKKQNADDSFSLEIVVVDNDYAESAKEVVMASAEKSRIPIHYFAEPVQNIALARNRAFKEALGDFMVFIDDDELPSTSWLSQLLKAYREFNADGVLGPVIPKYEVTPPKWVVRGRFFERPTHDTGTFLHWSNTRTGNVLLGRQIFADTKNRFRPEFGIGGEDRDFFRRMIDKGFRFVWCTEAFVYEVVPANRWSRVFMLKRAIQRGMIPQYGPSDVIESLLAVPLYSFMLPFLFFAGHHRFMNYLVRDFDHIGRLLASLHLRFFSEKYLTS
jgi:succinoglycan biosynthesis protein ExoM